MGGKSKNKKKKKDKKTSHELGPEAIPAPVGKASADEAIEAKAGEQQVGAPAPVKTKMKTKDYERELATLQGRLVAMQEWVKATGAKILIVFEGRDTAGKGGTIKRITERVSPRVFRVVALPAPTEREKSQMYIQRYVQHFPAAGEVVIFDRSWYNRAGVERVMGFCTEEESKRFLSLVPGWSGPWSNPGSCCIKYWLEVGPDEQTRRLESRIGDPRKTWKLTDMDLKSYSRWYDYSRARDDCSQRPTRRGGPGSSCIQMTRRKPGSTSSLTSSAQFPTKTYRASRLRCRSASPPTATRTRTTRTGTFPRSSDRHVRWPGTSPKVRAIATATPQIEARARELLDRMAPAERLRLLAGYPDLYKDMLGAAGAGYRPPLYSAAAVPRLGLGGSSSSTGHAASPWASPPASPSPWPALPASTTRWRSASARPSDGRRGPRAPTSAWRPASTCSAIPAGAGPRRRYGENSAHIGEMGAAFVRGLQRHVMGCAKHFACNSIEESRFQVDVRVHARGARPRLPPPLQAGGRRGRGRRHVRLQLGQRGVVRTESPAAHRRSSKSAGGSTASW